MNILRFQNVSKIFPGEVPVQALTDIHFQLEQGCFSALVGVSGSGKTTLLNLASGLDLPTSGQIWIGENEISALQERALCLFRRKNLGFIFQSYNLFPTLSVRENVEYTLLISGCDPKLAKQRAQDSLSAVGLLEKERFYPKNLSGGQQQRVAVARALASKPKIILADEPTANLDYETGQMLIQLFKDLNQKQGVSFLFSTHDRELIGSVKTIINIRSGKITNMSTLDSPA